MSATSDYMLPEPNRYIFNLDKVGTTYPIARGLQQVSLQTTVDMYGDMMLAQLSAYVLSEHLAADTVEESTLIPRSWWDHCKHDLSVWAHRKPCRILTRWWVRRHPSQDHKLTLMATWTRKATRPQSQIRVPDKLGPIVYQEQVSYHLDDPRYDR